MPYMVESTEGWGLVARVAHLGVGPMLQQHFNQIGKPPGGSQMECSITTVVLAVDGQHMWCMPDNELGTPFMPV